MLRRVSLASVLAALTASGCAMFHHGRAEFKPVSDADFGRLAPDQMGPVDAARGQVFAAGDAVSRATLRLEEAKHEAELAQAEQTSARADKERARAEQDAAQSSNAPDVKARAQESAVRAELHARATQAHAAYAQRLLQARQAELDAAGAHVKVREAELERAKLTALAQAGIPAATKYDPAPFDAHVADAQRDYQQDWARASSALREADQTRNAWVALNQQYQARLQGAAAQTGTGTSQGPLAPGTSPTDASEAVNAPASPPPAPPAPPAPQGTTSGQ